jgi:hypothetical protein
MNMNSTAHTIIFTSIATALALFTALSAAIAGLDSTAMISGISLFVAVCMIEIMIQSYAEPSTLVGRRRTVKNAPTPAAKVFAFPTAPALRKAA